MYNIEKSKTLILLLPVLFSLWSTCVELYMIQKLSESTVVLSM